MGRVSSFFSIALCASACSESTNIDAESSGGETDAPVDAESSGGETDAPVDAESSGGETEDDGTASSASSDASGAGCESSGDAPECGDGIRDYSELCDLGDLNGREGESDCMSDCMTTSCGDGYLGSITTEQCEQGILSNLDCFQAGQILGLSFLPGGTLDCFAPGTPQQCQFDFSQCLTCGNGEVNSDYGEVCDDANLEDGDGCSADCLSNETCGNGILDLALGEVCDDGNLEGGDGCSADCMSDETCGNGIVDELVGENCEPGITELLSCSEIGGEYVAGTQTCSECTLDESLCVACGPGEVFVEGYSSALAASDDSRYAGVENFCIGKTEVSVLAYSECEECTGLPDNGDLRYQNCNAFLSGRNAHPMNCLQRFQMREYCEGSGMALPTRLQWEWAARGGHNANIYPWGDALPNCVRVAGDIGTTCVGSTVPVSSAFVGGGTQNGILHLAGNVWEAVSEAAVWKGGSYRSTQSFDFSVLSEFVDNSEFAIPVLQRGFRCVRQ